MDAVNSYQVFDWLWTSGQLSEQDIIGLPAAGFDTVINLALPSSTNALKGEAELVTGLHMNYFQIPVEWELPVVEDFLLFSNLMRTLQGHKIWLHCAMNMRVSVFVYLYRKLCLLESEDQAAHPLREVWEPNEIWQEFIMEVGDHFRNQKIGK